MKRRRMTKKQSKKSFKKGSRMTPKINKMARPMRGGIRM